jgi:hypothetical protein
MPIPIKTSMQRMKMLRFKGLCSYDDDNHPPPYITARRQSILTRPMKAIGGGGVRFFQTKIFARLVREQLDGWSFKHGRPGPDFFS